MVDNQVLAGVPQEVLAELPQILSNLIAADNQIRQDAEKAVNDRLANAPEAYLLALASYARSADSEVMRTFSLVLLRRLLFREIAVSNQHRSPSPSPTGHNTLYDHLSEGTRGSLEKMVLSCMTHEEKESVRRKCADTVSDIALGSFERGRDWEGLRVWIGEACARGGLVMRESAYTILSNVSALLHDIPLDTVLPLLQAGLQLPSTPPSQQEISSTYAAFQATSAYLRTTQDPTTLGHSITLLVSSLSLLPRLPLAELPRFLAVLTNGVVPVHPSLFGVHLGDLLGFFAPMLLPTIGEDPSTAKPVDFETSDGVRGGRELETPTTSGRGVFTFPPTGAAPGGNEGMSNGRNSRGRSRDEEEDTEEDESSVSENSSAARLAILEFMLSLTEAKPGLVRRAGEVGSAWVRAIVRGCLEGLAEIRGSTKKWLRAIPASGEGGGEDGDGEEGEGEGTSVFEQALDRLSIALSTSGSVGSDGNGRAQSVLAVAFTYIPAMLVHSSWKVRHAGLMGIACLAEGGRREMGKESGKVVGLVLPLFNDAHPRVRWAACQCIGQLCTDLEELIEEEYYDQIIKVLIPALEASEPRVHQYAAAALINFCETVSSATLTPYLPMLVPRLLHLLQTSPHTYVQEQAITSLAMVADASEAAFVPYYGQIMPLLLNVLVVEESNLGWLESVGGRRLRCKAMECCGLIAIAVGNDAFRTDSRRMVELLTGIQNKAPQVDDAELNHYLIATWAKLCQAMGKEFEPCLSIVMPPLLHSASLKADVSVMGDSDSEGSSNHEGWETMEMNGQQIGIKTSIIEEKCQAFEMLVLHVSTLNEKFGPWLHPTLEQVLPNLRFFFHDGVREACALLIPMLMSCAKETKLITEEMFDAVFQQLINVIGSEPDASFLASLYKCFADTARLFIHPSPASQQIQLNFPPQYSQSLYKATQSQLHTIAQKRKQRASLPIYQREEERDDLALLEEMEEFALEDMAKCIQLLEPNSQLLIAVGSVRELSMFGGSSDWPEG